MPGNRPGTRYAPEPGAGVPGGKSDHFDPVIVQLAPGWTPGNAKQLVERNPARIEVWIYNDSAAEILISGSPNMTAADAGEPIPPGVLVIIDSTIAALYAVWAGVKGAANVHITDLVQ